MNRQKAAEALPDVCLTMKQLRFVALVCVVAIATVNHVKAEDAGESLTLRGSRGTA